MSLRTANFIRIAMVMTIVTIHSQAHVYRPHQQLYWNALQQCAVNNAQQFPVAMDHRCIFMNKNQLRPGEEKVIRHIPVLQKYVTQAQTKTLRHVPIVQKVTRQVVDSRTHHVPVVRHRYRTVEEKYTEHVPVTESVTRPVVDTVVKQVPMVQTRRRYRPSAAHSLVCQTGC